MADPVPAARPLKVGLVLPQMEDGLAGRTPRWTDILAVARRAEALGFDSLWLVDHLVYQFPFGDDSIPPHGLWEGWTLLAALASATRNIELGLVVACANFRNPAVLAKMADTVDEVSGGRFIFGLGAGYHDIEFRTFGLANDHLVGRFEEAMAIIAPLLRGEKVSFEGRYARTDACVLRPRGPRPDGPPLLVGANGPRMLELTARFADAWNAWGRNSAESVLALLPAVDAACRVVGRDPATLARTAAVMVDVPGVPGPGQAPWIGALRGRREPPATGSTAEIADLLCRLAAGGIGHVQLWIEPNTVAGIEAFAPVLALLDGGERRQPEGAG